MTLSVFSRMRSQELRKPFRSSSSWLPATSTARAGRVYLVVLLASILVWLLIGYAIFALITAAA